MQIRHVAPHAWDAANRLVSQKVGQRETRFAYDGQSRIVRVSELEAGVLVSARSWLWCGPSRCAERDLMQPGAPIGKRYFDQGVLQNGEALHYVVDHLGSVRQLIDADGKVRARYDYDPYGNRTKTDGDVDADMGFAGLLKHRPSGLDLAVYRAYDPTKGRWLNRDPIAEDGGLNLYGYVGGNPLNQVDPNGLRSGGGGATLQVPTTLLRQQTLPGFPGPLPGPQTMPTLHTPVNPYAGRQAGMQLIADSIGNIDFRTPSNLNAGNPLPGFPVPPGCTLICVADKPGQCSASGGCIVTCGPVASPISR